MTISIIRIETKKIQDKLTQMLNLVLNQHLQMIDALVKNNIDKANQIIKKDRVVNALFDEIHSDLEFLITKTPLDKDLRRTMAYIMIAQDLERIGDYVKNIGKFIIFSPKNNPKLLEKINQLYQPFVHNLKELNQVIQRESFDKAVKIAIKDQTIDNLSGKLRKELISSITKQKKSSSIEPIIFAINLLNAIERASNHIVHICELIGYIHTGKHVDLV